MVALRPSAAGRWMNCAASPHLQEPFTETESEAAAEGTAAHWVAEQVLNGVMLADELIDRKAPNGVIITGDMVDHVQMYVDAVQEVSHYPAVEYTIPMCEGVEDGTPDATYCIKWVGHVWDFKYGWSLVEAIGNWQLACYIIGLFNRTEWGLTECFGHIVQPRPWHPDGPVRSWRVSRDEALVLKERIEVQAAEIHTPGPHWATSGNHCRNCLALATCEAARMASLNAVDVTLAGIVAEAPVETEMALLRRAKSAITMRLDAVESRAVECIQNGAPVPGWSLIQGQGHRRWKDNTTIDKVAAMSGVTNLTELKPVTPAEALRRKVPEAIVEMLTERPDTGFKLVEQDANAKAAAIFGETNNE